MVKVATGFLMSRPDVMAKMPNAVLKVLGLEKKLVELYQGLAQNATINAKSTEVVLGKFMQDGISYVEVAKTRGATYFQLANWDDIVKMVGESNVWNINRAFILQQINAGKSIVLSHSPFTATGYFQKEVNLLIELGYKFVKDGSIWRAIK